MEILTLGKMETWKMETRTNRNLEKWIFKKCNVEKNANFEKFRLGKMQTWKNTNFERCKVKICSFLKNANLEICENWTLGKMIFGETGNWENSKFGKM